MPMRSSKCPVTAEARTDQHSKEARIRLPESRLSLSRETAKLVVPHPSTKVYSMTSATRGVATTSYVELKATPILKLCPKPPPGTADSLATRCARKAAHLPAGILPPTRAPRL